MVGDPPNIIIASRAGLSFNDFLIHMLPIVVVVLAVFVLMLPRLFRGSFDVDADRVADVMSLEEREAIRDPALLIKCGAVLVGRVRRVHLAFVAAHRAVDRRPARCGCARVDRPARAVRLSRCRGMGDLAVLRGPVHHGRRAGEDRRDRPACAAGDRCDRRECIAHRDTDPGCISPCVGDHRQHPLCRYDDPDRRGAGGELAGGKCIMACCGGRWRSARISAAT